MKKIVVTELWRTLQFKRNKGHKVQWNNRMCSGICGVLKGSILFKFDDKEILCRKNEALFIPEGISYTLEYPEDAHLVLFNFKTLEIHDEIKKIKDTNLYSHFKTIHSYFVLENDSKIHYVFSEFYKILALFSDERHSDKYTKIVKSAEKIMVDNLGNSGFVCRNVAEQLEISEVYLARLFKAENGIPPRKFLMKIRMEEAKSLLEEHFSVTQVAQMVGYKDVFQFSKAYKNHYGYSPKFTEERNFDKEKMTYADA